MRFESQTLGLPSGTEALLRELVHERTGIFFAPDKADILMDKLSPLVVQRGFRSFLDYYYLLKYDEHSAVEWRNVMNAVSVGETYFWREIDQVHALTQTIVPQWFATHRDRTMRIWSAACSTGEEPLTIAMALDEAGWFDRAPIEILASDGSSVAIDKAGLGTYRERSFRNLSPERRDRYFLPDATAWRVRPEIQSRVRYSVANLMNEPEIAPMASANVIFCRNVFIYFSETAITRTVKTFANLMRSPAYLFVGASESLLRVTREFDLEEVDDAFVYMRSND